MQHGLLIVASTLNGAKSIWSSETALDEDGAPQGREFIAPDAVTRIAGISLFTGGVNPGVACIAELEP
jgi:hypothetical protein